MRKLLIAAVAALTVIGVAAAIAIAQTESATLTTTVSPKKAGTAKKPRSTNLTFKVVNHNPNATLAKLDILMPRTLKLVPKGFPKCTADTLDNNGKAACPKGSKVGTGTASAVLGVNNPPDKRTPLTFKITAFTGGANAVNFYLESNELSALKITSPGKVSKKGHKLTITVPKSAQSPDGVTYAGLQDILSVLGSTYKGHKLIQASGCTKGQHLLNAKLYFVNNGADPGGVAAASDGAPCKKP